MKKFGQIKSNIETLLANSYGKDSFKSNIKEFKKHVLSNKQISEIYYIYDDLSSQKGLSSEIVSDYVNESLEKLSNLINKNEKKINSLMEWIDGILNQDVENQYSDIDFVIYDNKITNLEKVLESKKNIKKVISTKKQNTMTESVNIPLSSMLKIATNTFNNQYSTISEEEKNELKSLLSMGKKEIEKEFNSLKESVISKLKNTLNESDDTEMVSKVSLTINKINESKADLVSLYKLKQLEQGL
jgi:G:T/U-mismatch repair DNA glycosylase